MPKTGPRRRRYPGRMAIVLAVVLGALLVMFAAAMWWQERRRLPEPGGAIVYGVEDALVYVWERLPADVTETARRADVSRILEWEIHYLQHPSERSGAPGVAGSVASAAYVQNQSLAEGHAYEPEVIFAVLDLQAEYLRELGAVGDAAAQPESGS